MDGNVVLKFPLDVKTKLPSLRYGIIFWEALGENMASFCLTKFVHAEYFLFEKEWVVVYFKISKHNLSGIRRCECIYSFLNGGIRP